ncbi:MAG TPA: tRNA pseudouridine(55) synthase TruB [Phycisphaerales bacterium]|nr:tRNA pseudouridine(55) synthase TruB [Phycisphaerales bacterium]
MTESGGQSGGVGDDTTSSLRHSVTPELPPAGILLVDKDTGYTSMDVCAIVRSRLRKAGPHVPKRIKVGHAGTLDPLATGLLVVLVGKATKLCDRYMADTKVYEASIDLARTSTTDDAEGALTEVPLPAVLPTRSDIERIAREQFTGVIMQRPPSFSAISVGGQRSYDLARKGRAVELAARPVRVDAFEVLSFEWPLVQVRITCGKGTYIRSLARDLGAALNVGGMLTALRRTRSGEFDVARARTLAHLPPVITQADLLPLA